MKITLSILTVMLVLPVSTARPAARAGVPGVSLVPAAPGMTRSAQAGTPACTDAVDSCKEALSIGAFTFWYFRSYSLNIQNSDITRAVIVIHGLQRNAGDYFTTVTDALHNNQDPSLVVIAPHFKGFVQGSQTCADATVPGELYWSCTGQASVNRWDDGGQARNMGGASIYSFSMIDRLIATLSDQVMFPNLTKITLAGHSDGG